MSIANASRRLLIRLGKVLPFFLCFVVLISFLESLFSLATKDYLSYNGSIILNTPISFVIANFFECDFLYILTACVISLAIEACKWNLFATMYLVINLVEKHYFESIELYEEEILAIVVANIIASGFLTFKGVSIFLKNI